jgi:hypothetical protein
MPDPDAAAKAKERGENRGRLFDAIDRMKLAGLRVTQEDVNALAADYNVTPIPQLGAAPAPTVPA